jgi:hypothetical protein
MAKGIMKDDVIAAELIDDGLVGAYQLETTPFNVNTPATYDELLQHTRSQL